MAQTTAIEWTDLSWNPTHGCSKVSPGCAHCYAETLSRRYNQTPKPWTPANAAENVLLKPKKLDEPLSKGKDWQGLGDAAARAGKTDGKLVFVNSMSDLFHEQIPVGYIAEVFVVMALAERQTFQVLTKRPERMRAVLGCEEFYDAFRTAWWRRTGLPSDIYYDPCALVGFPLANVWLGTSIENRRFVDRADLLRETPAAVRFISAEPLLGPLVHDRMGMAPSPARFVGTWDDGYDGPALDLTDIDWLIVGGESGAGHRPIKPEWVRDLRDCATSRFRGGPGPAFLFKQWGGPTSKSGGRELDGRTWDEFPQVLA